jgi:spore coat polysaccharide biosynthesis protein SpsF
MKTDQEKFWQGKFGESYVERNDSQVRVASNIRLFSQILSRTLDVKSILELGSNIGQNLIAIQSVLPESKLTAVEINSEAADVLESWGRAEVIRGSILELDKPSQALYDLTFTKGVLIHINPDHLIKAYQALYENSKRYILVAEYFNPSPVSVPYRGHDEKLFKRDFAGDLMDLYGDLKIVDYGFCYKRDPNFKQDDITWFLLEKGK